ncbi:dihydropyrimidinase [alpha proteobacterium U9-1i]|nr:dihydropyrimidinase [alpha proteobacterium U9-1i]
MGSPLLIKNGVIVNADGQRKSDALLRNGRIETIGDEIEIACGTIDASGMLLMPGGVDPHVHLSPFVDDFSSGSSAALAGGITTIGVMAFPDAGESVEATLLRHTRDAEASSGVDAVFHSVLNAEGPPDASILDAIAASGQSTFKLFTMLGQFDEAHEAYVELLRAARARNLMAMFHCEDAAVIARALSSTLRRTRTDFCCYEGTRPVLSEVKAVQKVIALCELTGCAVYIVHLSSAEGLKACMDAQQRGLPVFVETRPIYLHLSSEKYCQPDGRLYVSFPPIRALKDSDALWRGLANGAVHTLGSDHAPLLKRQKLDPAHDLEHPRPGVGNLEEMLPMFFSEGVVKRGLSLERFVAVTSANAAKLLGLYPRKGAIAVGSDADLNIWDPSREITIDARNQQSRADFSAFEGWRVTGAPRITIKGGVVVCEDGRSIAGGGTANVLRRSPHAFPSLLANP